MSHPLVAAALGVGVGDARVLETLAVVPRARYVPPGYEPAADRDRPIPIGGGQVTTQPSLVAMMVEALALTGAERVLEIGTGLGYQAEILGRLSREVWSIERRAELAAAAAANLAAVLVLPHWGPNMTARPLPYIRRAARALLAAGAALVAGHSAHVVHGARPGVLYDPGDFVDDSAVHPALRNDLGLLFLVELDAHGPRSLEAVPLKLDFCHTRLATGDDATWIRRRFVDACAELGTTAVERGDRVVADMRR